MRVFHGIVMTACWVGFIWLAVLLWLAWKVERNAQREADELRLEEEG